MGSPVPLSLSPVTENRDGGFKNVCWSIWGLENLEDWVGVVLRLTGISGKLVKGEGYSQRLQEVKKMPISCVIS